MAPHWLTSVVLQHPSNLACNWQDASSLEAADTRTHRASLESAGPQNHCDDLNALGDNQLPADSQSAWKLHASALACTVGVSSQLIVTECIQVITKNTVHHKACALSKEALCHNYSPWYSAKPLALPELTQDTVELKNIFDLMTSMTSWFLSFV